MTKPVRVFVAVNDCSEIGYRQSTAMLIASLIRQQAETFVFDVNSFSIRCSKDATEFCVRAIAFDQLKAAGDAQSEDVEAFVRSVPKTHSHPLRISTSDLIFIRTNPGRDLTRSAQHDSLLEFCQLAEATGIVVVNSPARLKFFASKASLALLDGAYRPEMIVSNQIDEIAKFVAAAGTDCVVKPVFGSRGKDVIRIGNKAEPAEKDRAKNQDQTAGNSLDRVATVSSEIAQAFSDSIADRTFVAQHFVASDRPGDLRVIVCDGKILRHGHHVAGIARVPAAGEFRANLHTGGTAAPLTLSNAQLQAVQHAATSLMHHGIWLAGIDLIGDKIIEFNVFSTGGFYDASRFAKFDFSHDVIESLLAQFQPPT